MKKCSFSCIVMAAAIMMSISSLAQVTTRSLTWNLTGTQSWPTVGAGNNWDNKANWVITGTSTVPATNVTNGDKLIIPNTAGVRINVTTNLTISLTNFVIETKGAARFNLNSGVDLTLSGAASAFSMSNSSANAGLTLSRRASTTNPTQLIINGVVKALNNTNATIVPSTTTTVALQALSSSGASASAAGYGGFLLGALPVSLGNFSVSLTGTQKVGVSWTTLQEINTDHFDLQRSTDGSNWQTIATVKAAGNSSSTVAYSSTDVSASTGNNFYRLLMVDADGKSSFSMVKAIRLNAMGKISIYPNPASNNVVVSLSQVPRTDWQITITNSQGQLVTHKKYSTATTVVSVPVSGFANGEYYLQISDGNNVQTGKLVVLHP